MFTCFGNCLFIRFTACVFCKLLSLYVDTSLSLGFEGWIWELIAELDGTA